ncbi:hypothetical protein Tco_0082536, partial [Tanacetum coccineum]
TVCNRESNNSKENTDDSLTQQPKTVTETSSVVSPFKVDKAWKEKFFHPANHVRVEEPQKARENTDAPIIEDWVSDDEEEVESIPKVEKKTDVPTATKKESVKTVKPSRRSVRYAEMYRSQRPRGNQRSWNGQKSAQLGFIPEDGGDDATMEQIRKMAKWDNDDYVCRGLILKGMFDSLFDIYQNLKS